MEKREWKLIFYMLSATVSTIAIFYYKGIEIPVSLTYIESALSVLATVCVYFLFIHIFSDLTGGI